MQLRHLLDIPGRVSKLVPQFGSRQVLILREEGNPLLLKRNGSLWEVIPPEPAGEAPSKSGEPPISEPGNSE